MVGQTPAKPVSSAQNEAVTVGLSVGVGIMLWLAAALLTSCSKSSGSHADASAATPATSDATAAELGSQLLYNYPLDPFATVSNSGDPQATASAFTQQSASVAPLSDGNLGFAIVDQATYHGVVATPHALAWDLVTGDLMVTGPDGAAMIMAPEGGGDLATYLADLTEIQSVLRALGAPAKAQAYLASAISQLQGGSLTATYYFDFPIDAFATRNNTSAANAADPGFLQQSAMVGSLSDGAFGFDVVNQATDHGVVTTPHEILWDLTTGDLRVVGPGGPVVTKVPGNGGDASTYVAALEEIATVLKALSAPPKTQAYVASVIAKVGS